MRIVAASALLSQAVTTVRTGGLNGASAPALLAAAAGVFLLVGLWTPIVGALAAIVELLSLFGFSREGDPWVYILLCCITAALALLGPGGYSVDARIFGWKRIDIGDD